MSKANRSVYIDNEVWQEAKRKGINISQFVNNCLRGACSEDIEKQNKVIINEQINQLTGKLDELKIIKEGFEQEELREIVTGKKKSELIEIED